MKFRDVIVLAAAALAVEHGCVQASAFPQLEVSAAEAAAWIRHVTPLPKEIRIVSRVAVSAGNITVSVPESAHPLVSQAAKELREAIGPAAGAAASNLKRFDLSLESGGTDAEPLKELPNSDQAYRIIPGENGLRLVALDPTGVYYAAKTLKQLIKAKATGQTVQVPLVTAKDWPDLAKRGLWGADTHVWIQWMSDRKLNLVSHISALEVDSTGRGRARHKGGREQLTDTAPLCAVAVAPVVLHLEQVGGKGLFDAYPNLRAKGGKEGTICYSQPQIVDVLADWYADLASIPGVESVEQWLAENLLGQGGCRCAECAKTDRDLLELQVVLKARQKAGQRVPGIRLGVSTSEETAENNDKIFSALPKGVHAWYYHSLLTYSSSHIPMVPSSVADFASRGGDVGAVPSLCSNVNFPGPFTGPHFVHARMNEFVNRKLTRVLGYPSPGMDFTRFNVEAMAEWSWNSKGRSPREFAASWAVREGIPDPDLFAEWCEANGQAAWDVYGSCWPEYQKRRNPKRVWEAFSKRLLPSLEEANANIFRGPWGDFTSPEQFARDVELAERSVEIARKIGRPEIVAESLVVQGYMQSLNALWELNKMATPEGIPDTEHSKARVQFQAFLSGLAQARDALVQWVKAVSPAAKPESFLEAPLKTIEELSEGARKTAAGMGVALAGD